MKRLLMLIALAALVTVGTASVQAATRQKMNACKRATGSCENCSIQENQIRGGGTECKGCKSCANSAGACMCQQKRQSSGAGGGNGAGKGKCMQKRQGGGTGEGKCAGKGKCGQTDQPTQQ